LGFGPPLCDFVVQSGVQVGSVEDTADDVDGLARVCSISIAGVFLGGHVAHHSSVFYSLFSQTEFKHFDALYQVLVYAFLPSEHTLELVYSLCHLTLLEEVLCLFCELCALHIFERGHNLIQWDLLACATALLVQKGPPHKVPAI